MQGIQDLLKDKAKLHQITKAAFLAVDTDESGFLEKDELEQVMNNVALDIGVEKPTQEEVNEVLNELDENGDGKLSLDEFQVLIEQVLSIMATQQSSKK